MDLGSRMRMALLGVAALAGCAGCVTHSAVVLPPAGAPARQVPGTPARQVLDTYLKAVQAGDCATAHALATATFRVGNGELCGDVDVKTFTVDAETQVPDGTISFATQLVTGGSGDGSIPPGHLTWFYNLKKQANGSWRLISGGSGP